MLTFKLKTSFKRHSLVVALWFALSASFGASGLVLNQQDNLESLKAELKSRIAAIQEQFAAPPHTREEIPAWQVELARRFALAAETAQEIVNANPPDSEMWRERLETLRLYSQPISPPSARAIFGAGEVEKRAHILNAPAAVYTDEARAANISGDVRLRMVLASDGSVKFIFPIKSLDYGLTEAAIRAAREIKFEPAIRDGKPASQFVTLVYDFKKGHALPPYIPRTVF